MPSLLLDDSAIVERYLKLRRNESSELKSLDVSDLMKDDGPTRDISFSRRESDETGNSGLLKQLSRTEMVTAAHQETSIKLEYIKEAANKDDSFSGIFIKNDDHEMNMEEIRKNFAEAFAKQGATLAAIEERSTESDDEELECREFEDFYENGLNMYEETSKHSLRYSNSSGSFFSADSFMDNNFIDISTMDGEVMTGKVMRYFKKNWWLIYPEGRVKSVWDYLMGLLIVGWDYADIHRPRAAREVQLLRRRREPGLGHLRPGGRLLLRGGYPADFPDPDHARRQAGDVAVGNSEVVPEAMVLGRHPLGAAIRTDVRQRTHGQSDAAESPAEAVPAGEDHEDDPLGQGGQIAEQPLDAAVQPHAAESE